MALLIPTLRADVTLCETYQHADEPPLDIPITVFGGLQDPRVSREELDAWHTHSRMPIELHLLPGNHFFLKPFKSRLVSTIAASLATS